ncbi:hypothetical protein G9A89_001608 [Geosiphon pyriformis]|nr:hypothetical protein G9A89_001608 [Geosiphon pyriformis]
MLGASPLLKLRIPQVFEVWFNKQGNSCTRFYVAARVSVATSCLELWMSWNETGADKSGIGRDLGDLANSSREVSDLDTVDRDEYVTQCDPPPTCNNPCEVVRCGSLKPMCVSVPAEDCQSCPTAACVSSDEPEEGPKGWKPEKTPKGWKIGNPHWIFAIIFAIFVSTSSASPTCQNTVQCFAYPSCASHQCPYGCKCIVIEPSCGSCGEAKCVPLGYGGGWSYGKGKDYGYGWQTNNSCDNQSVLY